MNSKALIIALAAIALATTAAWAGPKHKHARKAVLPPAQASSFDPPRFIEIRPGLIIGSYQCVTDDGYGRYLPCDYGGSKH